MSFAFNCSNRFFYWPSSSQTRGYCQRILPINLAPFFYGSFLAIVFQFFSITSLVKTFSINGVGKCFLYRISVNLYSLSNQLLTQSSFFGPLRKSLSLSVIFNPYIVSFVSILDFWGSPSAIFFRISIVVIDSIKRGSFKRAFSHISKKVFKFHPIVRNCDSSGTVMLVSLSGWKGAAFHHRNPDLIFRSFRQSMSGICKSCSARITRLENTFSFGIKKLPSFTDRFFSTFATTQPPLLVCSFEFLGFLCFGNNRPISKNSSCQINSLGHNNLQDRL